MNWFDDILRHAFFAIDSVIYSFISTLYELLMYLANFNIFGYNISDGEFAVGSNSAIISDFTQRIYILLGIFMLFKVSFSILQYLVDPNSFSDKSKGMGKLVTNVLVVLVLLVLTPTIFSFAYKIQYTILNNNVISRLILGDTTGDYVDQTENKGSTKANDINETIASDMQFLVFGSFFTVNTDLVPSCKSGPVLGTRAMATAGTEDDPKACLKDVNQIITDGRVNAVIDDFFKITGEDYTGRDFNSFGDLVELSQNDKYYFNYQFGISTIAGVFIVIMLLSYCLAVAVRTIKLFFLQLISPIPIVSYVDPKQGKDGILIKWAKECGKTYASLFIRLAIIFLAFYLIDLVASINLTDYNNFYNEDIPEGEMSVLFTVMLILGILIFANQTPKLIEEIFGLKSTGEYTVNPLKRIKDSSLATAAVGGAIGQAVGVAGWLTGGGIGRALLGGFEGAKNAKNGYGASAKAVADTTRMMRKARADGSTFWGRRGTQISSFFGTQGAMGHILDDKHSVEEQIKEQQYEIKQKNELVNGIKAQEEEGLKLVTSNRAGAGIQNKRNGYLDYIDKLQAMKSSAEQAGDTDAVAGFAKEIRDAEQQLKKDEKKWAREAIDLVNNGTLKNDVISNAQKAITESAARQGVTLGATADDRHDALDGYKNAVEAANQAIAGLEDKKKQLEDQERVAQANIEGARGVSGGYRHRRGGRPGPGGPGPMGPPPGHP